MALLRGEPRPDIEERITTVPASTMPVKAARRRSCIGCAQADVTRQGARCVRLSDGFDPKAATTSPRVSGADRPQQEGRQM
jgi:hypothetical protein